jgi:hypothetical protein
MEKAMPGLAASRWLSARRRAAAARSPRPRPDRGAAAPQKSQRLRHSAVSSLIRPRFHVRFWLVAAERVPTTAVSSSTWRPGLCRPAHDDSAPKWHEMDRNGIRIFGDRFLPLLALATGSG